MSTVRFAVDVCVAFPAVSIRTRDHAEPAVTPDLLLAAARWLSRRWRLRRDGFLASCEGAAPRCRPFASHFLPLCPRMGLVCRVSSVAPVPALS